MRKRNKNNSKGGEKNIKYLPETDRILKAAIEAAKEAVIVHRRYNVPLVVYKNGKTIKLDPHKVDLKKIK
jgi:hypothetical protein